VGTKTDLAYQRQVSHEEGVCLASDLNANYFEISSAINTNVQGLFNSLVFELLEGV
jgi:ethanolamine utilization protein EutP (predicted NTPase)